MKRKSTKTIAWILLAVFLFMAGRTCANTVEVIESNDIDPECLVVADYAESYDAEYRMSSIMSQLNYWQNQTDQKPEFMTDEEDFFYYASIGDRVITNAPGMSRSEFQKQKYAYTVDYAKAGEEAIPFSTFRYYVSSESIPDSSLYVAIKESAMASYQKDWTKDREVLMREIIKIIAFGLLALGMVIYLYAVAGRKHKDEELHLMKVDRIYTEVYLLTVAGSLTLAALVLFEITEMIYSNFWQALSPEAAALFIAGFTGMMLLTVMLTMPIVRKIKGNRFLKDCLCVRVISWCWRMLKNGGIGVKSFFDGSAYKEHLLTKRLFRSQLAYICGSALLLLFFGLMSAASYSFAPMLLFGFFELLITSWYVMGNRKAYSDINAGYVESLKSQMKSENTKTALITNVSHDLKTPLTSIITYIDLLAKEDDLSATSRDYVNIIAGKAERLKHIVSDLFDLSKSISGNIPLELEILDLKKLMEQTLADMKDRIEGSGHALKINLGSDPANILSDGKKLYRVFQNIIDNALKYSLAGSRIFIDLKSDGDKVSVAVKNTAGYEMNFTEEEILQRFTRGDESRTSEGSGLGLSIAESFTQSCGGRFDLTIDGDQFKVTVDFPTVEVTGREAE
jgi:signal transduction histidine kinase